MSKVKKKKIQKISSDFCEFYVFNSNKNVI